MFEAIQLIKCTSKQTPKCINIHLSIKIVKSSNMHAIHTAHYRHQETNTRTQIFKHFKFVPNLFFNATYVLSNFGIM
jgi:hypothetical protein